MIKFDFDKFGTEKRISKPELTGLISITYAAAVAMWNRKTVRPEILREMETALKCNLSRYIIKKEQPTK